MAMAMLTAMAALRQFLRKLIALVRRDRAEAELSRELAAHLGLLEEEYQRRGLTPEQARRSARLALGGVEQTKDRQRDARTFAWIDDARRDAAHAVRLLRRNPILTATAALSLAIGIGANTAVFSVANGLLFRPPVGVTDPARLVDIGVRVKQNSSFNPGSYAVYLDIRQRATLLDGVYAQELFPHAMSFNASADTGGERAFGHAVTVNYFTVLGVRPAAGRLFDAGDSEQPGASPVAVLSHEFWMRRFNGASNIAGQAVRINGHPFTIVGVAPEGFHGSGVLATDIWVPLTMAVAANGEREGIFTERAGAWLTMGARMKPGVTVAAAAAEVEAIGEALRREYPNESTAGLRLLPASPVAGARGLLTLFVALLLGIVSMVLLVACANVSSMLLARATARRQEIAVRLAIGASRARLIRQLLMETVVLFLIGGLAGIVLARVMTMVVVAALPALPFPVSVSLALDGRIVALTMGLSLIAAIVSGLAPALQASKADPVTAMKDESQGPSGRAWMRHAFVITQVACSLVLVIAAGLFVRALARAGSVDPGFDPRGVELATVDFSTAGYTNTTGPRFARELMDRVRQMPEVQSATLALSLPGGFEVMRQSVTVPGVTPPDGASQFDFDWNIVDTNYFGTLRIPLAAGRDFSDGDRVGTQPVAIVSESTARLLWPGQHAVGKYMLQDVEAAPAAPGAATAAAKRTTRQLLVIGVAHDVKSSSLVDGLSGPLVYVPLQQHYIANDRLGKLTITARTTHGQRIADALRMLVQSMDRNLPIAASQTLEESVALGLTPQRIAGSLSGTLGIVGLLLAAVGIYGVMAYAVTRRAREFGIRIALGARRADIVRMVLRQGLTLIGVGCAIGIAIGAVVAQVLTGFLFGLPPLDPIAFGGAAALFVSLGLLACYGPARRATRVDPLVTLRRE